VTCNGVSGRRNELLCTQRWRSSKDRRARAVRTDHDEVVALELKGGGERDGGWAR
jgi:hypothetical protein